MKDEKCKCTCPKNAQPIVVNVVVVSKDTNSFRLSERQIQQQMLRQIQRTSLKHGK